MKTLLIIMIIIILIGFLVVIYFTDKTLEAQYIDSDIKESCKDCAHAIKNENDQFTCHYKDHPKPCKFYVNI